MGDLKRELIEEAWEALKKKGSIVVRFFPHVNIPHMKSSQLRRLLNSSQLRRLLIAAVIVVVTAIAMVAHWKYGMSWLQAVLTMVWFLLFGIMSMLYRAPYGLLGSLVAGVLLVFLIAFSYYIADLPPAD